MEKRFYSIEEIKAAKKADGIEMVRINITLNWGWAARAIVRVYENQTADEKQSAATTHLNGVGFSGVDARGLTLWAKLIKEKGKEVVFSERKRQALALRAAKYAKQCYNSIQ